MSQIIPDLFFASYLDELRAFAVRERGVPAQIAHAAADATLRALASGSDSIALRNRAKSYFWKVVRKSCLKTPDAAEARGHFLLAAVVADLEGIGWTPSAVWEEIQRGWADRVPTAVLEEYRQRLCA